MSSSKSWVIPVAVGVISFGSGLVAGYFLGKRSKKEALEAPDPTEDATIEDLDIVVDPDDLARDKAAWLASRANHPSTQTQDDGTEGVDYIMVDPPVPREPRPNPADITVDPIVLEGGHMLHDDPEVNDRLVAEFIKHNRFANDPDDWNMEEEMQYRQDNPNVPHVIHRDEFWNEELGYTQISLGYYEVNDILVDDENVPIYNFKKIIGPMRWGHGSGDPNVFHVRNDKLEAEYEILCYRGEEYIPGEFDEPTPKRHPRKKIKPPKD